MSAANSYRFPSASQPPPVCLAHRSRPTHTHTHIPTHTHTNAAHNKGFYDLYGEDGLKEGVPDGRGGILGGAYSFDASAQPLAVFAKFFGTSNPFEALTAIAAQYQATTDDKPMQGKHKMVRRGDGGRWAAAHCAVGTGSNV